jgi:hypothetical protein
MSNNMLRRVVVVGLVLIGVGFVGPATAAVTEAELAQISLNAISLCVHAALYQHDGLDAAALYRAALTVEHPAGATPAERECLWAKLHSEGGQLHAKKRIGISPPSTDAAVIRWYALELQPLLASLRPAQIASALAVSVAYSLQIKHGRVPHPRHFALLAELPGVPLPEGLMAHENATTRAEPGA